MPGLLKNVGDSLLSFGSGVPRSQIDTIRNNREISQIQLEQARGQQERQQRVQSLTEQAAAGDEAAMLRLIGEDVELAERLTKTAGLIDTNKRESAARFADQVLASEDPEARTRLIMGRIDELNARNADPSHTKSLLSMSPQEQNTALRVMQQAALTASQRRTGGKPSDVVAFEEFTQKGGLKPGEVSKAARIELGLEPRAGLSAQERIANDPNLTDRVAGSQAEIREATKFAEQTGTSRAKAIDSGFESIQKIDANIRNLDNAIAAIDEGASTGAIESRFFPTIRAATVELEQIQAQLGLDVVQSVQFGALSEGELQLALSTALPTGLQPAELKQWIQDRKDAQTKLKDYYVEQIDFLDQGGTVAGFLRKKQRDQKANRDESFEARKARILGD